MESQLDLLPPPMPRKTGRPKLLSDSDMERVREMVASGVDYNTISKCYGVSYDMITAWIGRYKWVSPTKLQRKIKELNEAELVISKSSELLETPVDALTVLAEQARRTGLTSLAGFVKRASPVFDKFDPAVPETIGEASILLKMISKAAGLDSQPAQTNVQVNIATGPWGGKTQSHRDTVDDD